MTKARKLGRGFQRKSQMQGVQSIGPNNWANIKDNFDRTQRWQRQIRGCAGYKISHKLNKITLGKLQ